MTQNLSSSLRYCVDCVICVIQLQIDNTLNTVIFIANNTLIAIGRRFLSIINTLNTVATHFFSATVLLQISYAQHS